jgi:hypothetical protein
MVNDPSYYLCAVIAWKASNIPSWGFRLSVNAEQGRVG